MKPSKRSERVVNAVLAASVIILFVVAAGIAASFWAHESPRASGFIHSSFLDRPGEAEYGGGSVFPLLRQAPPRDLPFRQRPCKPCTAGALQYAGDSQRWQ